MLILLGLIAGLSVTEIVVEIATVALLPLAGHAARFTAGELAKRVPSLPIAVTMALHAARFRLDRIRGLRSVVTSTCLLRYATPTPATSTPATSAPATSVTATPATATPWPSVETLLQASSTVCDLTPLCFRGDVSVRLPLAALAPVIGMCPDDILEVRGLGRRGEPWARCFRIGDDIQLPVRCPDPQATKSIANAQILRDGHFVAEVGQIARAWAPTLKDLERVAVFVVRDAARVQRTYEQLFLGIGEAATSEAATSEAAVEVRALATDLRTETFQVHLTQVNPLFQTSDATCPI